MRHVRYARLSQEFMRECGRKDPLFDLEAWSNGEEREGEWGWTTGIEGVREAALSKHERLMRDWRQRRSVATVNLLPHDEAAPVFVEPNGVPAPKDRTFEHRRHIRVVDGALRYTDGENSIELARFLGHRSDLNGNRVRATGEWNASFLLNGDGFDDRNLQQIQARTRERAHRAFRAQRVLVIPYMALNGAQIKIDTIRRVETTMDGNREVQITIPNLGKSKEGKEALEKAKANAEGRIRREGGGTTSYRSGDQVEFEVDGAKFRVAWQGYPPNVTASWQSWIQPENGSFAWHTIQVVNPGNKEWIVVTNVHMLGSSLFTAEGPDGKRHLYVSSFDMNEQPAMYFLAQLPDGSKAQTVSEAIDALAPPVVHAARSSGRRVYRQGDVFFVETNLTDEELKKRKAKVFEGGKTTKGIVFPDPGRNIYATGHIATSVARQSNGVTFAKGSADHHPAFTEPGRAPEHRRLTLAPTEKWFLCVRNTVPRDASTQDSSPSAAEAAEAVKEIVSAEQPTTKKKGAPRVRSRSRATVV